MALSEALLPEFDQEMALTRKCLERIPEDKLDWAPHEKSMKLGRLAGHIAEMPGWAATTFQTDSFDMAPPGGQTFEAMIAKSRSQVLEAFDKNVRQARSAIEKATDQQLSEPWSLLAGGKTIFTMPRLAVMRGMIINHLIHHRAQLGVYLRLNDVPVPSIYGPSADEAA